MKWFNHADSPIVVTLLLSLRCIVVYLLTEPCLVIQSSMFCTLIPRLNQGFCFLFFGGGEKFVTSGCCPSVLDVFVCVILHAIHLLSQLLRSFSATDGAVSLFFLFGVDGSVTVLVSQWDRSKTIVIKEKCKLVYLELVKTHFVVTIARFYSRMNFTKPEDQSRPTTTSIQNRF